MFQTIMSAWKTADLRLRMLYTLFMLLIFRLGAYVPVPGLSAEAIRDFLNAGENTLFGMLNLFSGGALGQATIFAMGITPYINASIIVQLLTVAIPALERMQKEGEEGRRKIAKCQRIVTILLSLMQSVGFYFGLKFSVKDPGILSLLIIVLTLTTGTAFLMWLGEKITEKGVGNGISLIIFAGIVSRVPTLCMQLWGTMQAGTLQWLELAGLLIAGVVVIGVVVLMNEAERRIPVQYAKRVVGKKMYGGQSTHIPIKVAAAGVIPIIFAMSVLVFPATIAQFFGKTAATTTGFLQFVLTVLSPSHWVYGVLNFFLILFFTYFYTEIQFNPVEIANNMKKNGGFIPGVRPGAPTADYIAKILSKITLVGAVFLGCIAVLPVFISMVAHVSRFSISGTSLLIVVGVALETVRQMESQLLMQNYKGFLD